MKIQMMFWAPLNVACDESVEDELHIFLQAVSGKIFRSLFCEFWRPTPREWRGEGPNMFADDSVALEDFTVHAHSGRLMITLVIDEAGRFSKYDWPINRGYDFDELNFVVPYEKASVTDDFAKQFMYCFIPAFIDRANTIDFHENNNYMYDLMKSCVKLQKKYKLHGGYGDYVDYRYKIMPLY